jgi:hypothetical protein
MPLEGYLRQYDPDHGGATVDFSLSEGIDDLQTYGGLRGLSKSKLTHLMSLPSDLVADLPKERRLYGLWPLAVSIPPPFLP